MTEVDRAIARRLALLRKDNQLSREDLADKTTYTVGYIARVELCRQPLEYSFARRLLRAYDIHQWRLNPLWLAFGTEPLYVKWPIYLPPIGALELDPDITLSAFAIKFKPVLEALAKDIPDPMLPVEWLESYRDELRRMRDRIAAQEEAAGVFENVFLASIARIGTTDAGAASAYQKYLEDSGAKKDLTEGSEIRNQPGVQSELQELLNEVRRLTAPRGTKAALASDIAVPLPRISEWLAGKYEPSGETTLRLLRWVERRRVTQKKNSGSRSGPPEPKTPKGTHSHENPSQGPEKQSSSPHHKSSKTKH